MLDININLPEIEEPKQRLSSVVVVPTGSKELVVDSTAVKQSGVHLFPHPPRKVATAEWAVRKPTNHGRHSSNIPRTPTHTITQLKEANNNNGNASSSKRLPNKLVGASSAQTTRAQVSNERSTNRQTIPIVSLQSFHHAVN